MRGSIRKRVTKKGARWDCIFREPGGKQVWKTFATYGAAADYLNGTAADVKAGTYRRVVPTRMTEVFARWEKALEAAVSLGQLKRSTQRSYISIVRRHLEPTFGRFKSDALNTVQVSKWKEQQAARVAEGSICAKTFNNMVGVFSACLDWAREQHLIGSNPLPKRLRAKISRPERPIVQGAEITRLWNVTNGQDRVIVALALFAGLRRGEVFGVRWSDVTYPKGRTRATIRIARAFVQRKITTPKSAAGSRLVSLPPRLVTLLKQHRLSHPAVTLGDGAEYIVRQDNGQPVDPDNWAKRVWPAIRKAAKLPATVTLHALRHTYGSLLLADGAPVKHVSEQMGHANPTITMGVYQHVLRATSATATRKLDRHIPESAGKPERKLRLVKAS